MNNKFRNYICWEEARIGQVINKEALTIDRAEFLATHTPFRKIAYSISPRGIPNTDEDTFLRELIERTRGNQHTFALVKGMPGTGKSHLIRWLKERYQQEHSQDSVLLLERARTSLKGVLMQIIESGVFNNMDMPKEFQNLNEAVTQLSSETLADTLLDELRNAVKNSDTAELPRVFSASNLHDFLLDKNIRQHLRRQGGGLQRVITTLSEGSTENIGANDFPGFDNEDFRFSKDILKTLEGTYENVLKVAQKVTSDEEDRGLLIRFLNDLLRNRAIQSATRLSPQDLKLLFMNLRRHLKQRGVRLALFIEDITSLTGIETGLLEVLITQHSDEDGLCQLTSVVGTTDQYYSYFQENIRQRITHLLVLNASDSDRAQSALMQDPDNRADLVARYLNAIRASRDEIQQWAKQGAYPEDLPNRCNTCPVRHTCHAAFGVVDVPLEDGQTQTIGLYPFNKKALNTLYDYLREDSTKTPRGMLDKIVSYILQTHTSTIRNGEFPPPMPELAAQVELRLSFNPPVHLRLLENQVGTNSKRLSTLFLVWGQQHIARTPEGIGGLADEVFEAFGLPRIQPADEGSEVVIPAPTPTTTSSAAKTTAKAPAIKSEDKAREKAEEWKGRVSEWWNGDKLRKHEDFEDLIAELFKFTIDWQSHHLATEHVKELFVGGKFIIEGRAAKPNYSDYYLFEKNADLRDALYALVDLNTLPSAVLKPNEYGEMMARLSAWVRYHEPRIVAWVRDFRVRDDATRRVDPDALPRLLTYNVLLTGCLAGKLRADNLYQSFVAFLLDTDKHALQNLNDDYPDVWRSLAKGIKTDGLDKCRRELAQMMNRPQGIRDDVRYLDAAKLMQYLEEFQQSDWQRPSLYYDMSKSGDIWKAALDVADTLERGFAKIIENIVSQLREQYSTFTDQLDGEKPESVVAEVRKALEAIRRVGNYDDSLNDFFKEHHAETMTQLIELLEALEQLHTLSDQALFLAQHGATVTRDLRQYMHYFELFEREVKRLNLHLPPGDKGSKTSPTAQLREQANQLYRDIDAQLKNY